MLWLYLKRSLKKAPSNMHANYYQKSICQYFVRIFYPRKRAIISSIKAKYPTPSSLARQPKTTKNTLMPSITNTKSKPKKREQKLSLKYAPKNEIIIIKCEILRAKDQIYTFLIFNPWILEFQNFLNFRISKFQNSIKFFKFQNSIIFFKFQNS